MAFLSRISTPSEADSTGRALLLNGFVSESRLRVFDCWTDFTSSHRAYMSIDPRGIHMVLQIWKALTDLATRLRDVLLLSHVMDARTAWSRHELQFEALDRAAILGPPSVWILDHNPRGQSRSMKVEEYIHGGTNSAAV